MESYRTRSGNLHDWAGHIEQFKDTMDYKSDRVDTTRMDKTAGKTKNKVERQPDPPLGSCVANPSQYTDSPEMTWEGIYEFSFNVSIYGGAVDCGCAWLCSGIKLAQLLEGAPFGCADTESTDVNLGQYLQWRVKNCPWVSPCLVNDCLLD